MFRELFIDGFKEGFYGIVIAIIFWFMLAVTASFLFYGAFYLTDSKFLEFKECSGVIVEKKYEKAHDTLIVVGDGKSAILAPKYVSESYFVFIKCKDGSNWVCVDRYTYESLNVGCVVNVKYCIGRLSKKFYIKEIFFNDKTNVFNEL